MPNSWIEEQLPGWSFTANSNKDADPHSDREEYFLGTNPNEQDGLRIRTMGGGRMRMEKSGGQMCRYVLETADQLNPTNQNWNWREIVELQSTNGEVVLPSFTASNLLMRVRINVPAE